MRTPNGSDIAKDIISHFVLRLVYCRRYIFIYMFCMCILQYFLLIVLNFHVDCMFYGIWFVIVFSECIFSISLEDMYQNCFCIFASITLL